MKSEKTILFGGLTYLHEKFLKAAVEHHGYKAEFLPNPDNQALQIGREFCSRGMCNPTYYTVGNLLRFLFEEKRKGVDVEDAYAFVTVGACGPCRFGMYEMEYRRALKEAGFKDFQVSILNQDDLSSEGLVDLTPSLIWDMAKAVWAADVLRDLAYQVRPYEIKRGETDRVIYELGAQKIYKVLRENPKISNVCRALREIADDVSKIEVDYSQPKPLVSVIGEFWAHTTESDGNYNMHRWLESQGAEVEPEPIAGWIDYQLFMEEEIIKLHMKAKGISRAMIKRLFAVKAMSLSFRWLYNKFRKALKNKPRALVSQKLLQKLAEPYFHHFVSGGEGHLEVARHVYNAKFRHAHMTLSIKPFGCMPSTQSDGAQMKVLSDYPHSVFLSVETSGDSEVNVKSRVQMKLFEAKKLALSEYHRLLDSLKLTEERIKRAVYLESSLRSPFVKLAEGTATAVRFVRANSQKIKSLAPETEPAVQ